MIFTLFLIVVVVILYSPPFISQNSRHSMHVYCVIKTNVFALKIQLKTKGRRRSMIL
jgi:hypothetical protein